jgi:hypothetical protein
MKRAIQVRSHEEGDALVRVREVPALNAAQTITGVLLELDEHTREVVLQIVQASLRLARNGDAPRGDDVVHGSLLTTNRAGSSGE